MIPPAESEQRRNLPEFSVAGRRIAVDVPHLLFATAIAVWCGWYWFDAYQAASDIQNLSLIEPSAILALIVYLFVLRDCIHIRRVAAGPVPSPRAKLEKSFRIRIVGTMVLLAIYVAAASYIGFDIASFLYIVATLLFLGERRPLVLLLTPAIFCVIAIYCFETILATPLPLFFGGEQ